MLKTQAVKLFLTHNTHADLAALYNADMEVQVNVAIDGGHRVEGSFNNINWVGYSDGIETWKSFRIPFNAKKEPHYTDSELGFSAKRIEYVGMTGWDWKNKLSRWVAFDFDAMLGHSEKHVKKLSTQELSEIRTTLEKIPWVTIRRSSSGRGLHIYVFLEPMPTNNHTEHAALARAILGKLAYISGINLSAKVDVCGGNMWVYARKAQGTDGLTLIKQGEKLSEIPENWIAHLDVVTGSRKRLRHTNDSVVEAKLNDLIDQKTHSKLDDKHRELLKWLEDTNRFFWWDAEANMLVTHTVHLAEAHKEFNYRGVFRTTSPATNIDEQNCFAYPVRNGAWVVRRYTPGVAEDASWSQDGNGWTRCFLNQELDFEHACRSFNGMEDDKGAYSFKSTDQLLEALDQMGVTLVIPDKFKHRSVTLKRNKEGRGVILVPKEAHDQGAEDWLDKNKNWMKVVTLREAPTTETDNDLDNYDNIIRHVVSVTGDNAGWVVNTNDSWNYEPYQHVQTALQSFGLDSASVKQVMGTNIMRPWTLVVRPFEPEYPGGRLWNKNAPQLKFKPKLEENLVFPTWRKVLSHVGKALDIPIRDNEWCKTNGIKTGEEYLMCWIAAMFQHPFEPLPYLFIYGEKQATGKSVFHESLQLLFQRGFAFAEHALINTTGFNGELEGAVLCVIEERDLNGNSNAYNRVKDWVTSPTLSIRHMRTAPYLAPNTTHWIHCCNERNYCPAFPGDTRIVMLEVGEAPENPIPKRDLFARLQVEAPDFLGAIMQLKLPESNDRMMLPAVDTPDKDAILDDRESPVVRFIKEHCYEIPGQMVLLSDFYSRFINEIGEDAAREYTKSRVSKELPSRIPKGRGTKSPSTFYGNISFDKDAEPKGRLYSRNGVLRGSNE